MHERQGRESPGDPRQLGIDEFTSYALIIDARTPHEYDEDHLPGAINLPVVDDTEFAEVGIAHVSNPHAAYVVGAAYALNNIATHIRNHISRYRPGDRLLSDRKNFRVHLLACSFSAWCEPVLYVWSFTA